MSARRLALAAAMLALAASPAEAQRKRAPVSCRVDTTGAWHRRQRAWADESRHDWTNDSLRVALLRASGLSASTDPSALLGFEVAGETATATGNADTTLRARMLDSLRALARNRQAPWPTRSVVGPAGVRAVWLLASADSALARTTLHRMMEAGPDESPPAAVAMLEDRLRIRAGRRQIYGTQLLRAASGALVPAPTEYPQGLDMRRDAAGLPPLAQALCAARTMSRR